MIIIYNALTCIFIHSALGDTLQVTRNLDSAIQPNHLLGRQQQQQKQQQKQPQQREFDYSTNNLLLDYFKPTELSTINSVAVAVAVAVADQTLSNNVQNVKIGKNENIESDLSHDSHDHHSHSIPAVSHVDFIKNPILIPLDRTNDLDSSKPKELLLEFDAYKTTFRVKLQSNTDFSLQGALLFVFDGAQQAQPWETSLSSTHVYKGIVVDALNNPVQDSYARIVVQDHDNFILDGVISSPTMGMFHIKHIPAYQRARREIDLDIAALGDPGDSNSILIRDLGPKEMMCAQRTGSHATDDSSETGCSLKDNAKFNQTSTKKENLACGTIDYPEFSDLNLKAIMSRDFPKAGVPNLFKRQQACPLPNKKVLAMGVAADCSYVQDKGGISETLTAILSNWNQASAVFESTFNVQLGVTRVSIQATCTPLDAAQAWNRDCSVSSFTISDRLNEFSKWRGARSSDGVGLWHLMTKCSTQPAVGIAWVNQLCQTGLQGNGGQTVSGTGVSSIVPVEWKVVAHEIGHNFGAIHDCSSAGCNDCRACSPNCDCQSQYLMNPLDNSVSSAFSPGSIKDICAGISSMGSCLVNPGALSLVESGVCGNGIKEGNEQCDCGISNGEVCNNDPCCDGRTCQLKAGKQCDPRNDDCCSETCTLLPATTICHKGDGICDKTVSCLGTSATCPFNTFIDDGSQCTRTDGIKATCVSGICTSRDLQCKGTSVAITTVSACPAFGNECFLSCQDRNGNCYQLTGNFLDGTTCGGTGRCKRGKCEGSNIFSQAILWIQTFPQYSYPILVLLGVLTLSILYGCIRRCVYHRNRAASRGKGGGSLIPIPSSNLPRGVNGSQNTINSNHGVNAASRGSQQDNDMVIAMQRSLHDQQQMQYAQNQQQQQVPNHQNYHQAYAQPQQEGSNIYPGSSRAPAPDRRTYVVPEYPQSISEPHERGSISAWQRR